MTINASGNDLNRGNTSDVQVQFAGNPAVISHQNLLISRNIGIRHKEVPVFDPPTEPSIGTKTQPDLTISTRDLHDPRCSRYL